MKKLIIGIVGEIASGKDTVADYLIKKHHAKKISFSVPIRDILDRLALPQTRSNMKNCGEVLRGAFGKDLFSKIIAKEVKNSKAKIIILPNVRTNDDLIHLKKLPEFVLVAITADPKIRYERLTKRGQNADDKTKTWNQFKNDQHLSTEIHIKKLAKKAHYHLDNNGNQRELYSQIEETLKKMR